MTQQPTAKVEAEQKRRKLKSLDGRQVYDLIEKGITEFHNGGQRRRHVTGATFMYITYKTKPESNRSSGVMRGDFFKWCKGYVKDGKMMLWCEQGGEWIEYEPSNE